MSIWLPSTAASMPRSANSPSSAIGKYEGACDLDRLNRAYSEAGVELLVNRRVAVDHVGEPIEIVGLDDLIAGRPDLGLVQALGTGDATAPRGARSLPLPRRIRPDRAPCPARGRHAGGTHARGPDRSVWRRPHSPDGERPLRLGRYGTRGPRSPVRESRPREHGIAVPYWIASGDRPPHAEGPIGRASRTRHPGGHVMRRPASTCTWRCETVVRRRRAC